MYLPIESSFKFKTSLFGFLAVALMLSAFTKSYAQGERSQKMQENPLIGTWESEEAVIEFRPNGTITINGESYKYKVIGKTITVSGDEGSMDFPFQLSEDRLTVSVDGRIVVYKRVSGGISNNESAEENSSGKNSTGGEGIAMELVGKWCYMSNLTGSNARMSNRCFTLFEDGTYEYYAETSSSGSAGSSASQESDSGRWSVSGNAIIAYSNTMGRVVYPFEKRNHPKTGDPMIVLDGDAYVTAFQKAPW